MNIDYPFYIDGSGRTGNTDANDHLKDMIEQVLFTSPGERVNRPDFGCGLMRLVFASNSDELATATQFLVQGALQQWLGDLMVIQSVDVRSQDETLEITFRYKPRYSETSETATFKRKL